MGREYDVGHTRPCRSPPHRLQNKSDTFSIFACHPCAGAMLIFSVSFHFAASQKYLRCSAPTRAFLMAYRARVIKYEQRKQIKRGRAGIEPATSPTRGENHTSRPTALENLQRGSNS